MNWMVEKDNGVAVKVFIQPRASRNAIAGIHDDTLKIKLTAPPVDNAANKMCIDYLSKCLDIPRSSLEIISGRSSRKKQILIRDAGSKEDLKRKIEALLV